MSSVTVEVLVVGLQMSSIEADFLLTCSTRAVGRYNDILSVVSAKFCRRSQRALPMISMPGQKR